MRGEELDGGEEVETQKSPIVLKNYGAFSNNPAATYSPTQLPVQYHRP